MFDRRENASSGLMPLIKEEGPKMEKAGE
nr:hypothetical protein B11C_190043 [Bartonella sp. 1-1C]CBI81338.1 hypothetical protein B11C_190044 [Bartonella sp. 1-1C]